MANETFLLIALAVAITVVVMVVIMNVINKHRIGGISSDNNVLSVAIEHIWEIVSRVYTIYETLGRINETDFNNDEEYRATVIERVINIIVEICDDYGHPFQGDKTILTAMAIAVVETVLDKYESINKQDTINSLEVKVANLEKKSEEVKVSNGTAVDRDTVTVQLGDFYENT